MSKDALIILEPAVFLLIPLAWAGWEFWAMRKRTPRVVETSLDPRMRGDERD